MVSDSAASFKVFSLFLVNISMFLKLGPIKLVQAISTILSFRNCVD